MREDSPVLKALRENPNIDLVNCRWCGKEGHQMQWRWTKGGAHGFCSKSCQDKAKEQVQIGNNDWWKEYHPENDHFIKPKEETP